MLTGLSKSNQTGKPDRDRGRLLDVARNELRNARSDDTNLLKRSEAILLDMEQEAGAFFDATKTLRDKLSQPAQVAA